MVSRTMANPKRACGWGACWGLVVDKFGWAVINLLSVSIGRNLFSCVPCQLHSASLSLKHKSNRGRSRWWYTRFLPWAVPALEPCEFQTFRFSLERWGNKSLARAGRFVAGGVPHIRRSKTRDTRTSSTLPARYAPRRTAKFPQFPNRVRPAAKAVRRRLANKRTAA